MSYVFSTLIVSFSRHLVLICLHTSICLLFLPYTVDAEVTNNVCILFGELTGRQGCAGYFESAWYQVDKVISGTVTGSTIEVLYYPRSVTMTNMPRNAILLVTPHDKSATRFYAIGYDKEHGILADTPETRAIVMTNLHACLETPISMQIQLEKAVAVAHDALLARRWIEVDEATHLRSSATRYPFGWELILVANHGHYMVTVGDDGIVKYIGGGL
jgi:hypothetical protein